jgi:glycine hydroxymethyltransferase
MLTRSIVSACKGVSRLQRGITYTEMLRKPLKEADPEIYNLIKEETARQKNSINLIASENYASVASLEAMGSPLNNKYSEGYPGARYYGGCEVIDKIETLAQQRALEAFNLDPAKWGVNLQGLSGAPANLAIYFGVGGAGCKILGPELGHGGHLSHGFYLRDKHVSATSAYFNFSHYRRDPVTDLWNYDEIELIADRVKPKIIVAGYSSYSHHYDYKRMKEIAMKNNGYLLADMSHISGLVSAGLCPNPFDHSDVVMTTTHKTLGTVRNALIFYRKGVRKTTKEGDEMYDLETKINEAVFPGHFGGPHNHAIAGSAVGLKVVTDPLYKDYQKRVAENAKVLCEAMRAKGYPIVGNGTSNHMAIINVKEKGIDGARVEYLSSKLNISLNKNVIPGGQNAVIPGGIRLGSPAMTTRGCNADDFKKIADYLDKTIQMSMGFRKEKQTLSTYKKSVDEALSGDQLKSFKKEVESFASSFPFLY